MWKVNRDRMNGSIPCNILIRSSALYTYTVKWLTVAGGICRWKDEGRRKEEGGIEGKRAEQERKDQGFSARLMLSSERQD